MIQFVMKSIFLNIYFWFKATLASFGSSKNITLDNTKDGERYLKQHNEEKKDISLVLEQMPKVNIDMQLNNSFRARISKRIYSIYNSIILKKYEKKLREINNIQPGELVKVSWMKDLAYILPKDKIDKIVFNLYIKQPHPGMSIKMNISTEVGHTFIGLKLFGKSSNDIVKHIFGYYPNPNRHKLLSGTPFENKAESCFMDDSEHFYHIKLSKEISINQHIAILELASKFEKMEYDLCENNCTDFGINAANLADIVIHKTAGDWVVGEGNNPADLGQAILYGLYFNKTTKSRDGIKIDIKRIEEEFD